MGKRVSLEDLIEAKIIKPPFPIWVKYKGQKFDAEIDQHGFVQMEGKPYTSLSLAGGIVRAKISGKPSDGLAYRRVNGWTFWSYTNCKGSNLKLNCLRNAYKQLIIKG